MSGVFQNIYPPTPSPPCEMCTPPPMVRGRALQVERGGGPSIFLKTPDTALYSIYVSTLCSNLSVQYLGCEQPGSPPPDRYLRPPVRFRCSRRAVLPDLTQISRTNQQKNLAGKKIFVCLVILGFNKHLVVVVKNSSLLQITNDFQREKVKKVITLLKCLAFIFGLFWNYLSTDWSCSIHLSSALLSLVAEIRPAGNTAGEGGRGGSSSLRRDGIIYITMFQQHTDNSTFRLIFASLLLV